MIERLETNYVETFTGKKFWPLNPVWEDIDIVDIAHALSNKCRYTGHTRKFYSVAQHSVLVSENVPMKHRLEGLLHDASEAYLPDVAWPIKPYLEGFFELEDTLEVAVAKRFNLKLPWDDSIKEIDKRITQDEAWHLMNSMGRLLIRNSPRLPLKIDPWGPRESERRFLEQYDKLVTYFGDVPDPYHFERITHLHNVERRNG